MLSTVDMVVQRRDGPRRLRDHDDDVVHVVVAAAIITSCYSNRSRRPYRRRPPHRLISRFRPVAPPCESPWVLARFLAHESANLQAASRSVPPFCTARQCAPHTDSTDSKDLPDCLPILRSISVFFYFLVFSFPLFSLVPWARSVQFCSRPRSDSWPHHGRTLSIYLCPLSF